MEPTQLHYRGGFGWFLLTHFHQFIHGHSWSSPSFWKSVLGKDRFSANEIPDLTGKVAIVTGANKGIGYHTALELASHGCSKVFLACRSRERAMAAIKSIKQELWLRGLAPLPNYDDDGREIQDTDEDQQQLQFLELDLADIRQCQDAAKTFLAKGLPLHILINNAGIGTERTGLIDGIECHMAVNHFGPFAFTLPLVDRLIESQPSRVVIVSSIAHECSVKGGINFERMNDPTLTDNHYVKYAQSKTANILFAKSLARRLVGHKVYVNAVHPGVVDTAIFDHIGAVTSPTFGRIFLKLNRLCAMTAERGALTQLYCATSPEIEGENFRGQWFIPIGYRHSPKKLLDRHELQDRLWEYSEQLVASRLANDGKNFLTQ
ncbi:hypothetical protein DFQ26_006119 [Actinomortierella ambigua]|nr:hypothetical protein DFQ26_006119 [Actinomortierella ambigua]